MFNAVFKSKGLLKKDSVASSSTISYSLSQKENSSLHGYGRPNSMPNGQSYPASTSSSQTSATQIDEYSSLTDKTPKLKTKSKGKRKESVVELTLDIESSPVATASIVASRNSASSKQGSFCEKNSTESSNDRDVTDLTSCSSAAADQMYSLARLDAISKSVDKCVMETKKFNTKYDFDLGAGFIHAYIYPEGSMRRSQIFTNLDGGASLRQLSMLQNKIAKLIKIKMESTHTTDSTVFTAENTSKEGLKELIRGFGRTFHQKGLRSVNKIIYRDILKDSENSNWSKFMENKKIEDMIQYLYNSLYNFERNLQEFCKPFFAPDTIISKGQDNELISLSLFNLLRYAAALRNKGEVLDRHPTEVAGQTNLLETILSNDINGLKKNLAKVVGDLEQQKQDSKQITEIVEDQASRIVDLEQQLLLNP